MHEQDLLASEFEHNRDHLRAVAYRMLGSVSEAEDAVQEAWLRLSRADAEEIRNLTGWLTTVVGRVCLDMLRSRKSRREEALEVRLPDPILSAPDGVDAEDQTLLADAVGLALFVVLETLSPAERLAFVLHDMFGLPFDDIAPLVDRTPTAARKLASRARRRVQAAPSPEPDLDRQWELVDAFLAASREGDFEALLEVLDPDAVLRVEAAGGVAKIVHGAKEVAGQALAFSDLAPFLRRVLVNGAAGVVAAPEGQVFSLTGFTVRQDRIVAMDILADPERLREIDLAVLDE